MSTTARTLLISGLLCFSAACGENPSDAGAPPAPGAGERRPVYDPSTATASVSGRILLEGTAPESTQVRMLGDPFCVRNGIGQMSEDILATEDGALRNVIVYVRSGHADLAYPVPATPVLLDQKACVYIPHVLTLMAGQDLRIANSDETFHNVHAEAGGSTFFNVAQADLGSENVETFTEAGVPIRVGCDVHRWMRAWVGVFDHPFHTVSDSDGAFELRVPPGSYELVAWHERYGESVLEIEVTEGESLRRDFTFTAG